MKSPVCIRNKKRLSSFSIVSLMLTVVPLWLILATANTSGHAQTTPSPADWTQFHRDNMQRWNPYETVLSVDNVSDLQPKWKVPDQVAGGFNQPSSPAVVNGVVYYGSADDNVYAVNAENGAPLWTYPTGDLVTSSPAVANGVVYVGSLDHNVYALNANTGALLWRFVTGDQVYSSPAVVNGVVYIGSVDSKVYALNAASGARLWSYATPYAIYSSPAVVDGVVYIGSGSPSATPNVSGEILALNASTGARLWSHPAGLVPSSPAVSNGVVYIGSWDAQYGTGHVYALNASTGALVWSYATELPVISSPAVVNGVVYVGSWDGNVYALKASTGAALWNFATGGDVEGSPAVANGVVYCSTYSSENSLGTLFALNASNGALLWSSNPVPRYADLWSSSFTIVNGTAYVRSGAGAGSVPFSGLYAFALARADLYLRINPSPTSVHQGDLLTYAFPVWNLGPDNAIHEVLNTQVPAGTTFDYIRISGTPGLGTCTHPPYGGTGQIICHEGDGMAPTTQRGR